MAAEKGVLDQEIGKRKTLEGISSAVTGLVLFSDQEKCWWLAGGLQLLSLSFSHSHSHTHPYKSNRERE